MVSLASKEYTQGRLKEFFIGLEIKNNRKNEKEVTMLTAFLFHKFRNLKKNTNEALKRPVTLGDNRQKNTERELKSA